MTDAIRPPARLVAPDEPRPTLEAVQALAQIARILGRLSEPDQQRVMAALGELR